MVEGKDGAARVVPIHQVSSRWSRPGFASLDAEATVFPASGGSEVHVVEVCVQDVAHGAFGVGGDQRCFVEESSLDRFGVDEEGKAVSTVGESFHVGAIHGSEVLFHVLEQGIETELAEALSFAREEEEVREALLPESVRNRPACYNSQQIPRCSA